MNLRYKKWLSVFWRALLASVALALFLNPEFQVLAPMVDILGSFGFDGLLLLVDIQLAIWLVPVFKTWVVPFLTGVWNRSGARLLGMDPSQDVVADGFLSFFHGFLRYGGQGGLTVYFMYISVSHHFAVVTAA